MPYAPPTDSGSGISSVLEVAIERCYNEHVMDMAAQQKKKEQQGRLRPKSTPSSKPTAKSLGRGQTLKLYLKKAAPGEGWAPVLPKDDSPDFGKPYETPQCQKSTEAGQAGRSLLTNELVMPGKDLTTVLDENNILGEQELVQAMSSILPCTDALDVEMEEVNKAMGFEPEDSHTGYDVNLVRHSDGTVLGSIFPVTAQESQMLDEDPTFKAPGTGRLGTEENPSVTCSNCLPVLP